VSEENVRNDNKEVIAACKSPIIRGGQYGPVGIARPVLNARRLVCHKRKPDLTKHLGPTFLQILKDSHFTYLTCPLCSGCL
jgi:hypothetical protein